MTPSLGVLGPSAAEADIVVTVISIVVVTICRSIVPIVVVPGTATGSINHPPDQTS
jgi:hypothetical protein